MKDWRERITSWSDLLFGLKLAPPLPPPLGRPVLRAFTPAMNRSRSTCLLTAMSMCAAPLMFLHPP